MPRIKVINSLEGRQVYTTQHYIYLHISCRQLSHYYRALTQHVLLRFPRTSGWMKYKGEPVPSLCICHLQQFWCVCKWGCAQEPVVCVGRPRLIQAWSLHMLSVGGKEEGISNTPSLHAVPLPESMGKGRSGKDCFLLELQSSDQGKYITIVSQTLWLRGIHRKHVCAKDWWAAIELLVSPPQADFAFSQSTPEKPITDPQAEAQAKLTSSQLRAGICSSISPKYF